MPETAESVLPTERRIVVDDAEWSGGEEAAEAGTEEAQEAAEPSPSQQAPSGEEPAAPEAAPEETAEEPRNIVEEARKFFTEQPKTTEPQLTDQEKWYRDQIAEKDRQLLDLLKAQNKSVDKREPESVTVPWDNPALVSEVAQALDMDEESAAAAVTKVLGPLSETLAEQAVKPHITRFENESKAEREKREAEEARKKRARSGAQGLEALYQEGGVEAQLVVDFYKHQRGSALWRQLALAGVDNNGVPEALANPFQVKFIGQALARDLEKWDRDRQEPAPTQESSGIGGAASRRGQSLGKPKKETTAEDEIAQSLKAQADRTTRYYPMLSDSFKWGS